LSGWCAPGLRCDANTCVKPLGRGATCVDSGCDETQGLRCVDGVCREPTFVGAGSVCNAWNVLCEGGAPCWPYSPPPGMSSKCFAPVADGAPCNSPSEPTYCLAPAMCIDGACRFETGDRCKPDP
jgi:hypothetical protein